MTGDEKAGLQPLASWSRSGYGHSLIARADF
jgi:hypothetical protein